MENEHRLPESALRWRCEEKSLPFRTTEELPDLEGSLGQDKAVQAIETGLRLRGHGFNIFVAGETGTGRSTTVMNMLKKAAATAEPPGDWCYVHNFENPDAPLAIALPPGRSAEFAKDMDELIGVMRHDIPLALDSKEYDDHRSRIIEENRSATSRFFVQLEESARRHGFAMLRTVKGYSFAPRKGERILSPEEFDALPRADRRLLDSQGLFLAGRLAEVMRQVRDLEKESKEAMGQLDRDLAVAVIGHHIDPLKEKYEGNDKLHRFLDMVQEDIIDNLDDFRASPAAAAPPGTAYLPMMPDFDRYRVNVLVNNGALEGVPVICESNPTYYNMFGRIEQFVQPNGSMAGTFLQVKAGALHRANGGYLVIDARSAFTSPFVWDSLKRAIRNREIGIEDVMEQQRFSPVVALKPEPVPLDCKIVLIGTQELYNTLFETEPDYRKLFKIKAEFESRVPRTDDTVAAFSRLVAGHCRKRGLLPFDRGGVGRLLEYSARLTEHQRRISCHTLEVGDIMQEADHVAAGESAKAVGGRHVDRAIEARRMRSNRPEERIREAIDEGTLFVSTGGEAIGQINGLAVLSHGDFSCGKPARITARVWSGKGGTINIEREAKLSGGIHDKGMLVLSAYLAARFSRPRARPFSASICFEQSYGNIDGDSASSTELYVLLSALSGVGIRQGIAVTGSVNQLGMIQPIGGVNEKIEGYFHVCRLKGLTGLQGVMIPKANEASLMLDDEVVQAVAEGSFHIWSVATVEEGIEVLTGIPAGRELSPGRYEEGSVFQLAAAALDAMQPPEEGAGKKE